MDSLLVQFISQLGPQRYSMIMSVLNNLEDFGDMFTFLWEIEAAHRCLTLPIVTPLKSEADAERQRTEGNISYKEGNYRDALKYYNTSILLAPHPEVRIHTSSEKDDVMGIEGIRCEPQGDKADLEKYKTLACGYANRSAVFLAVKDYDKCLMDVDMALAYGYPELLRTKLEERKERCLKIKAKAVLSEAKKALLVSNNSKAPPKLAEPNSSIPTFSNALAVKYSLTQGRHVVATRDISPGEVISVEKSYCSVISDKMKTEFCPVCVMQCETEFPCPSCCLVVFCSDVCRAKGLEEHKKECNYLGPLAALELDEDPRVCLAMKLVTQTTFAELKDSLPLLEKESKEISPLKLGFNKNGIYNSTEYRSVYHMSANHGKRSKEAISKACLTAFVLSKILHQSGNFFITREGIPFQPDKEDFIMVGTALLRHLAYQEPLFCISDVKMNFSIVNTEKSVVGIGVYPSLLLMRHSCNPPTVFYNFGHVKIVRTVEPIPAGQEVTLALFDRYLAAPTLIRKMKLQMVGVECSCEACKFDWPSFDIPVELHFKCIKCHHAVVGTMAMPSCLTCGINYSKSGAKGETKTLIKKWRSMVEQVQRSVMEFKALQSKIRAGHKVTKDDFNFLRNASKLLIKHVQQPNLIFCLMRDVFLIMFYSEM